MLGRTDRSLLGIWWWTVDRYLLTAILLLLVTGILMVMAASPAVAQRISLPDMRILYGDNWSISSLLLARCCFSRF